MKQNPKRICIIVLAIFALAFSPAIFGQATGGLAASGPNSGIKSDFETGQDNWTYRGDKGAEELVAVSTEEAHSGAASLKISKRTRTWHGAIHRLNDELKPGAVYDISAWVKYSTGPSTGSFSLSAELDGKNKSRDYKNLAGVTVKKGEWTKLEGNLTIPDDPNLDSILVYFETQYKADNLVTPDDTIDFFVDDIIVARRLKNIVLQEDIPSLKAFLDGAFSVGTAVSPEFLDASNPHRRLITKHFNAMVAGNVMKPDTLEPKEGVYNFASADKIVSFAEKTGMLMRGHTLVWHNQTPSWFFTDPKDPSKPATKELLLAREKAYIQAVVGHFQGQVKSWDVVNEVLSDSSGLRSGKENSKWFEIAGDEYIEKAFIWAHEADPDAELVINDYNLESNPAKREAMYSLVKSLKEKKIPIDGIGIQMHISIQSPSIPEIRETIERFASLGVKVLVTELDVSIYESPADAFIEPGPDILLHQAVRYEELFNLFKEQADMKRLDTVILWGSADDDTWLDDFPVRGRKNAPLLFDRDLQAKPAYWGIVDPKRLRY